MIHLERVALPAGLRALAYRDPGGYLVIYVSAALDPAGQRAAVLKAIRASRRTGLRSWLPQAGIAVIVAARAALHRLAAVLRVHPAAWGAAATATVVGASAAGVLLTVPPHPRRPSASGGPAAPSTFVPLPRRSPGPPAPAGHRAPAGQAAASGTAGGPGQPASAGKARPVPSPTASPTPTPTPTPSPAQRLLPSPGSSGVCVTLLGVRACVPPLSLPAKALPGA